MSTKKTRSLKAIAATVLINVAISLALILIADRILDASLSNTPTIFAPNSAARYQTIEFDAVANINRFGFRGDEEALQKRQVIAIGDSFTFGFGLSDDTVWPRLLEEHLREDDENVAVYNLGSPGSDTRYHIDIAMNYVDALEPKAVILSVLLGDDFQQVHEQRLRHEESSSSWSRFIGQIKRAAKDALIAALPGAYKLYHRFRFSAHDAADAESEPELVTAEWSGQAAELIKRHRLELPEPVRTNALTGHINPGLLLLGAEHPDRSWAFWQETTRPGSEAMHTLEMLAEKIARLNDAVESRGGQLFLLSMPSGDFVRSQFTESYRNYGARIPDESLESLLPESILEKVANQTGARFIPTLATFRDYTRQYPDDAVFFPIDGHLSPSGSEIISSIVSDYLAAPDQR